MQDHSSPGEFLYPGQSEHGAWSPDKVAQDSDICLELIKRIERYRIRVNPSSRLHRYSRLLRAASMRLPESDSDAVRFLNVVSHAVMEVGEIGMILDSIGSIPSWRVKMREILSGAIHPASDKNAHARNTQYELLNAMSLQASGYKPWPEEPDIRFRCEGKVCGLAVKRITSERKFIRRIADARCQADNAGIPTIIAVDISRPIFRRFDEGIWIINSPLSSAGYVREHIDNFLNMHLDTMFGAAESENVIGLFVTGHYVAHNTYTGKLSLAISRQMVSLPHVRDQHDQLYDQILRAYARWSTCRRAFPGKKGEAYKMVRKYAGP